jgi:hypothetical protein
MTEMDRGGPPLAPDIGHRDEDAAADGPVIPGVVRDDAHRLVAKDRLGQVLRSGDLKRAVDKYN